MSDLITIAFGIFIGLGYSLPFGFFWFNPFRKVKAMRLLLKKNYAIVHFKYGNSLMPVIKNLEGDVVRAFGGIWILKNSRIYRQVDEEKTDSIKKLKTVATGEESEQLNTRKISLGKRTYTVESTPRLITQDSINFKQGVPVVFLDMKDMLPLKFDNDPMDDEFSRNPEQVEATISKEISSAEAEAMQVNKDQMLKYMKIIMIVGILSAGILAYTLYLNIGLSEQLSGGIDSIVNLITSRPQVIS